MRARAIGCALLAAALLSGCGSHTRNVSGPRIQTALRGTWVGTLSDGLDGDALLEVRTPDTSMPITGDFVHNGPSGPVRAAVTGMVGLDSLHVAIGDGVLSGRLVLDSLHAVVQLGGATARFEARWIDQDYIARTTSTLYPLTSIGAVQAGDLLWLATTEPGYARVRDDALYDRLRVYWRPDSAWSSSALAWDGTRLWGEHPAIDGTAVVSDLLGFDERGRTGDSIRVAYRAAGLAYDGARLWTFRLDPPALLRIDAHGATLDSLHVEIPDAGAATWFAGRFWVTGTLLRRLYELGPDGHAVSFRTLPGNGVPTPAGLTADLHGPVYVESVSGTTWVHELEVFTAVPLARVLPARDRFARPR